MPAEIARLCLLQFNSIVDTTEQRKGFMEQVVQINHKNLESGELQAVHKKKGGQASLPFGLLIAFLQLLV